MYKTPFNEFLARCRKVTDGHIQNHGGKWDIEDQINHIHAEVTEFWLALHGKHIDEGKNIHGQLLEEGSDIIFASLTALHLLGMDDHEINIAIHNTLKKIEDRVEKKRLLIAQGDSRQHE